MCPRKQTTEPKLLILVSFFSGEVIPYTDTTYSIHILCEVCRSVFYGPPCIVKDWMITTKHGCYFKVPALRRIVLCMQGTHLSHLSIHHHVLSFIFHNSFKFVHRVRIIKVIIYYWIICLLLFFPHLSFKKFGIANINITNLHQTCLEWQGVILTCSWLVLSILCLWSTGKVCYGKIKPSLTLNMPKSQICTT